MGSETVGSGDVSYEKKKIGEEIKTEEEKKEFQRRWPGLRGEKRSGVI